MTSFFNSIFRSYPVQQRQGRLRPWRRRSVFVVLSFLLATVCNAQSVTYMGSPIYAVGPGDLPLTGSVVEQQIAQFDGKVCHCQVGWAQNWYYWAQVCGLSNPIYPGIVVMDQTTGQPLCPPMTVAENGLTIPQHYLVDPTGATIKAGDHLAVVVTQTGNCALPGGQSGGGELWETATIVPVDQQCY